MIKRLFLIVALILAPVFAFAGDLSGTYSALGRNPDGSAYKGVVTIAETGDTIHFFWKIGASAYEGDGSRNGDVLTVNWGDKYPVYYLVLPSGELHGTWANGTALEKLIPQ